MNLGWLCNLRFDYTKTFGDFSWLHVILTAPTMPSQGSSFTKIMFIGTQIHKALVVFVPSSTTVREVNYFFIMCGVGN